MGVHGIMIKSSWNCVRPLLVVSFIPDEGQFKPLDIIAEA